MFAGQNRREVSPHRQSNRCVQLFHSGLCGDAAYNCDRRSLLILGFLVPLNYVYMLWEP